MIENLIKLASPLPIAMDDWQANAIGKGTLYSKRDGVGGE
jgi:hypothetical protein